jgi:hypothetical protein
MREMILAKRPGLYVFHRAEECGGIGSTFIADETPELLDGIDYAIAFDRRGVADVITYQGWGRCCSDQFATALAAKLGMKYQPNPNGVFTDTANYMDYVSECTNISVGYYAEHSKQEMLDVEHIVALRDVMLSLDVTDLPAMRDPEAFQYDLPDKVSAAYGQMPMRELEDHYSYRYGSQELAEWSDRDSSMSRSQVREMVRQDPDGVLDLLEHYGVNWRDIGRDLDRWFR